MALNELAKRVKIMARWHLLLSFVRHSLVVISMMDFNKIDILSSNFSHLKEFLQRGGQRTGV